MATIFLSLGSNLGDRAENLAGAIEQLTHHAAQGAPASGTAYHGKVTKKSRVYEAAEWGGSPDSKPYLNQCILFEADFSPYQTLELLRTIEQKLGRDRQVEGLYKKEKKVEYAPRTIDLDILFYDDWFVRDAQALTHEDGSFEELLIPHPRLQLRKFVLIPLAEIAPDFMHPVLHKSIKELLKECPDTAIVKPQ